MEVCYLYILIKRMYLPKCLLKSYIGLAYQNV